MIKIFLENVNWFAFVIPIIVVVVASFIDGDFGGAILLVCVLASFPLLFFFVDVNNIIAHQILFSIFAGIIAGYVVLFALVILTAIIECIID